MISNDVNHPESDFDFGGSELAQGAQDMDLGVLEESLRRLISSAPVSGCRTSSGDSTCAATACDGCFVQEWKSGKLNAST